jgi:tetratricopeptide (TPR) repeat protein
VTLRRVGRYCREHPLAVALGCTCIAYVASFWGIFHFDDFGNVADYGPSSRFGPWWHSVATGRRSLLKLSYVINWKSGAGLAGFHAVNLAIHCGVVALVYYCAVLAKNSLNVSAPSEACATGWGAPFSAAVLFGAHPIHAEAVTYISGRSSSLMAFFYCAALVCYVIGARTNAPGKGRAYLWLYSPSLFVAACLVKETAITFPLALLLWERCFERSSWKTVLKRQGAHWSVLCVLSAGALAHPAYFNLLFSSAGPHGILASVHANGTGFMHLVTKLVILNHMSIDPDPLTPGYSLAGARLECCALVLLVALALAYAKKLPRASFATGWVTLQIFITYSVFSRTGILNERHMYLTDVGLFLVAGAGLETAFQGFVPGKARAIAVAALAGACMVFTNIRSLDYRSSIALWESTVAASPKNSRAWNNLGLAYERKHLFNDAKNAYSRALAVDSANGVATINLRRVDLRIKYAAPGD